MTYARILFDVAVFLNDEGDRLSGVKNEVVEMTSGEFDRLRAVEAHGVRAVEKASKGDFEEQGVVDEAPGGPPGLAGSGVHAGTHADPNADAQGDGKSRPLTKPELVEAGKALGLDLNERQGRDALVAAVEAAGGSSVTAATEPPPA